MKSARSVEDGGSEPNNINNSQSMAAQEQDVGWKASYAQLQHKIEAHTKVLRAGLSKSEACSDFEQAENARKRMEVCRDFTRNAWSLLIFLSMPNGLSFPGGKEMLVAVLEELLLRWMSLTELGPTLQPYHMFQNMREFKEVQEDFVPSGRWLEDLMGLLFQKTQLLWCLVSLIQKGCDHIAHCGGALKWRADSAEVEGDQTAKDKVEVDVSMLDASDCVKQSDQFFSVVELVVSWFERGYLPSLYFFVHTDHGIPLEHMLQADRNKVLALWRQLHFFRSTCGSADTINAEQFAQYSISHACVRVIGVTGSQQPEAGGVGDIFVSSSAWVSALSWLNPGQWAASPHFLTSTGDGDKEWWLPGSVVNSLFDKVLGQHICVLLEEKSRVISRQIHDRVKQLSLYQSRNEKSLDAGWEEWWAVMQKLVYGLPFLFANATTIVADEDSGRILSDYWNGLLEEESTVRTLAALRTWYATRILYSLKNVSSQVGAVFVTVLIEWRSEFFCGLELDGEAGVQTVRVTNSTFSETHVPVVCLKLIDLCCYFATFYSPAEHTRQEEVEMLSRVMGLCRDDLIVSENRLSVLLGLCNYLRLGCMSSKCSKGSGQCNRAVKFLALLVSSESPECRLNFFQLLDEFCAATKRDCEASSSTGKDRWNAALRYSMDSSPSREFEDSKQIWETLGALGSCGVEYHDLEELIAVCRLLLAPFQSNADDGIIYVDRSAVARLCREHRLSIQGTAAIVQGLEQFLGKAPGVAPVPGSALPTRRGHQLPKASNLVPSLQWHLQHSLRCGPSAVAEELQALVVQACCDSLWMPVCRSDSIVDVSPELANCVRQLVFPTHSQIAAASFFECVNDQHSQAIAKFQQYLSQLAQGELNGATTTLLGKVWSLSCVVAAQSGSEVQQVLYHLTYSLTTVEAMAKVELELSSENVKEGLRRLGLGNPCVPDLTDYLGSLAPGLGVLEFLKRLVVCVLTGNARSQVEFDLFVEVVCAQHHRRRPTIGAETAIAICRQGCAWFDLYHRRQSVLGDKLRQTVLQAVEATLRCSQNLEEFRALAFSEFASELMVVLGPAPSQKIRVDSLESNFAQVWQDPEVLSVLLPMVRKHAFLFDRGPGTGNTIPHAALRENLQRVAAFRETGEVPGLQLFRSGYLLDRDYNRRREAGSWILDACKTFLELDSDRVADMLVFWGTLFETRCDSSAQRGTHLRLYTAWKVVETHAVPSQYFPQILKLLLLLSESDNNGQRFSAHEKGRADNHLHDQAFVADAVQIVTSAHECHVWDKLLAILQEEISGPGASGAGQGQTEHRSEIWKNTFFLKLLLESVPKIQPHAELFLLALQEDAPSVDVKRLMEGFISKLHMNRSRLAARAQFRIARQSDSDTLATKTVQSFKLQMQDAIEFFQDLYLENRTLFVRRFEVIKAFGVCGEELQLLACVSNWSCDALEFLLNRCEAEPESRALVFSAMCTPDSWLLPATLHLSLSQLESAHSFLDSLKVSALLLHSFCRFLRIVGDSHEKREYVRAVLLTQDESTGTRMRWIAPSWGHVESSDCLLRWAEMSLPARHCLLELLKHFRLELDRDQAAGELFWWVALNLQEAIVRPGVRTLLSSLLGNAQKEELLDLICSHYQFSSATVHNNVARLSMHYMLRLLFGDRWHVRHAAKALREKLRFPELSVEKWDTSLCVIYEMLGWFDYGVAGESETGTSESTANFKFHRALTEFFSLPSPSAQQILQKFFFIKCNFASPDCYITAQSVGDLSIAFTEWMLVFFPDVHSKVLAGGSENSDASSNMPPLMELCSSWSRVYPQHDEFPPSPAYLLFRFSGQGELMRCLSNPTIFCTEILPQIERGLEQRLRYKDHCESHYTRGTDSEWTYKELVELNWNSLFEKLHSEGENAQASALSGLDSGSDRLTLPAPLDAHVCDLWRSWIVQELQILPGPRHCQSNCNCWYSSSGWSGLTAGVLEAQFSCAVGQLFQACSGEVLTMVLDGLKHQKITDVVESMNVVVALGACAKNITVAPVVPRTAAQTQYREAEAGSSVSSLVAGVQTLYATYSKARKTERKCEWKDRVCFLLGRFAANGGELSLGCDLLSQLLNRNDGGWFFSDPTAGVLEAQFSCAVGQLFQACSGEVLTMVLDGLKHQKITDVVESMNVVVALGACAKNITVAPSLVAGVQTLYATYSKARKTERKCEWKDHVCFLLGRFAANGGELSLGCDLLSQLLNLSDEIGESEIMPDQPDLADTVFYWSRNSNQIWVHAGNSDSDSLSSAHEFDVGQKRQRAEKMCDERAGFFTAWLQHIVNVMGGNKPRPAWSKGILVVLNNSIQFCQEGNVITENVLGTEHFESWDEEDNTGEVTVERSLINENRTLGRRANITQLARTAVRIRAYRAGALFGNIIQQHAASIVEAEQRGDVAPDSAPSLRKRLEEVRELCHCMPVLGWPDNRNAAESLPNTLDRLATLGLGAVEGFSVLPSQPLTWLTTMSMSLAAASAKWTLDRDPEMVELMVKQILLLSQVPSEAEDEGLRSTMKAAMECLLQVEWNEKPGYLVLLQDLVNALNTPTLPGWLRLEIADVLASQEVLAEATQIGFRVLVESDTRLDPPAHSRTFVEARYFMFACRPHAYRDSNYWRYWRCLVNFARAKSRQNPEEQASNSKDSGVLPVSDSNKGNMDEREFLAFVQRVLETSDQAAADSKIELQVVTSKSREPFDGADSKTPSTRRFTTPSPEDLHPIGFLCYNSDESDKQPALSTRLEQIAAHLTAYMKSNVHAENRHLPFPVMLPAGSLVFRGLMNRDGSAILQQGIQDLLSHGVRCVDWSNSSATGQTWAKGSQFYASPLLEVANIYARFEGQGSSACLCAIRSEYASQVLTAATRGRWERENHLQCVFYDPVPPDAMCFIVLTPNWRAKVEGALKDQINPKLRERIWFANEDDSSLDIKARELSRMLERRICTEEDVYQETLQTMLGINQFSLLSG